MKLVVTTSNKPARITAAGSGMGAAIASRLAADGYQVAVMSSSGNGEALDARRTRRFRQLYSDRYAKDNLRMNSVLHGYIDSLPEKAVRRARIPLGR